METLTYLNENTLSRQCWAIIKKTNIFVNVPLFNHHSCVYTFNKDVLHFSMMSHLLSKDILQLDNPAKLLSRWNLIKKHFFLINSICILNTYSYLVVWGLRLWRAEAFPSNTPKLPSGSLCNLKNKLNT